MKTDISRVKQLLQIKKVDYDEVKRATALWSTYVSSHLRPQPVQVDLALEPRRRSEMLAASDGVSSLPQLHLNNKYLGDWDTLQDMEDFGELDTALKATRTV